MDQEQPVEAAVVLGDWPAGQWPALGRLYQKPALLSAAHLLSPSPAKNGASLPTRRRSPPKQTGPGGVVSGSGGGNVARSARPFDDLTPFAGTGLCSVCMGRGC